MMILCERIRQLRKEKKWSQDELAQKIDSDARQISRYERGKITPSAETIVKLAKVFDVTSDYLLLENTPRKPFKTDDKELLTHLENIDALTNEDRNCLFHIIDSFITKNKIKAFAQGIN